MIPFHCKPKWVNGSSRVDVALRQENSGEYEEERIKEHPEWGGLAFKALAGIAHSDPGSLRYW